MFGNFIKSIFWAAALLGLLHSSLASALDSVTLQLKWTHAFQFAGYYAALEKGYYEQAGLDVRLKEAIPGTDPVQSVLSGDAQYGVGTSSLLLARKAGHPVVVLAVVFQHSPLVFVARRDKTALGTQGIHDLIGKRVMIEPQSDELMAYLKQEGISADRLKQIPHSFQPQDLIDGRVDAISAYVTNEPYYLDRARLDYQIYTPRSGGIDFYGDNLFTTESELKVHPERARAFREASLRGWQYAMEHPEEIAELIYQKYSQEHPKDFYLYEAQRMETLLRTDLIEVGYMTRGRWQHIANTYAELDLMPHDYPLDGFLYAANHRPDPSKLYLTLALLAVVSAVAIYIYRINRQLACALSESRAAEERIRHLAQHDPLTDLPNRALFADRLEQALANAKRDQQVFAVMFLDLDDFKLINDNLGHDIGDRVLQQVAYRLRASLRESDTVARTGGDEFIALLRNTKGTLEILAIAEKLRDALAQPFLIDDHSLNVSASIGIAAYPEDGIDSVALLKHADEAMYAAKRNGRNRVQIYGQT
ncbi:diguanylate cyclase domain-containing protein [Azonexus sp. IMCC34839]|uniref:diguanylate cyclase domain-containing protein n=1 Tax=Azonexus sp. IMCC34839 TaxID=3133695 RepID=UPI00399959A4